MHISAIVSVGKNFEIGAENELLWRISSDLKNFKKVTTGHAVLMGRKTYESIGRPLPNRLNVVITRDKSFSAPGCIVAHSPEKGAALAKEKGIEKLFVIGGEKIYKAMIGLCQSLHVTRIDRSSDKADAFFPNNAFEQFNLESSQTFPRISDSDFEFEYQIWERRHENKVVDRFNDGFRQ